MTLLSIHRQDNWYDDDKLCRKCKFELEPHWKHWPNCALSASGKSRIND